MSKRMKYIEEHLAFLEEGYKKMGVAELVKAFNEEFGVDCGFKQIRSTLSRYGFRTDRRPKRGGDMWAMAYTKTECAFLKKNSHLKNEILTNLFNKKFKAQRSYHAIQNKLSNMGLSKTQSSNRQYGDTCSYHEQGYVLIKTPQVRCGKTIKHYKYKHVTVWEKENGPIPKGNCLRFLDGDNQNCSIENLAMFTRTETLFLNFLGYNKAPKELRETIILVARLKARVVERRRELVEDV